MGIPPLSERPDLYDDYDGVERPEGWVNPSQLPERVQRLIAEREHARWQAAGGRGVFIENEGALFRGPARGLPLEVWRPASRQFELYWGGPKSVEWGNIVTQDEAERMMAEKP